MTANRPAFPRKGAGINNPFHDEPGMTMRQWYAGMALQGMVRNFETDPVFTQVAKIKSVATDAFAFADAMIREDEAMKEDHIVYLRFVDLGTDNECLVLCANCDPGAIRFVGMKESGK